MQQIAKEMALSRGYVGRLRTEIIKYTGLQNTAALLLFMSQGDVANEVMDLIRHGNTMKATKPEQGEGVWDDHQDRGLSALLLRKQVLYKPTIEQSQKARQELDRLTNRQIEVIAHYAEGFTMPVIAQMLGISPFTVADLRQDAMVRMGTKTVAHLVALVTRLSIEASFFHNVNGVSAASELSIPPQQCRQDMILNNNSFDS